MSENYTAVPCSKCGKQDHANDQPLLESAGPRFRIRCPLCNARSVISRTIEQAYLWWMREHWEPQQPVWCHHCGEQSRMWAWPAVWYSISVYRVECPVCGAWSPYYSTRDEAIDGWKEMQTK